VEHGTRASDAIVGQMDTVEESRAAEPTELDDEAEMGSTVVLVLAQVQLLVLLFELVRALVLLLIQEQGFESEMC
jgi:hypothetical protein